MSNDASPEIGGPNWCSVEARDVVGAMGEWLTDAGCPFFCGSVRAMGIPAFAGMTGGVVPACGPRTINSVSAGLPSPALVPSYPRRRESMDVIEYFST